MIQKYCTSVLKRPKKAFYGCKERNEIEEYLQIYSLIVKILIQSYNFLIKIELMDYFL